MATPFADDPPDSLLEMSEPDLPDLPVLDETFDFGVTGQEISRTILASYHDLPQSVPPSSDRGQSESHVPWAAVVKEPCSDDEDGLSADGLDLVSDKELDEVEPAPTEAPKWKINHARGDH